MSKKLFILIPFFTFLVLFTSIYPAHAVTLNSGDRVQVEFMGENETRIVAGRNVELTGELNGDVYVFAASLISKAIIHGDLIVFAGEALVTGDILGNIRGAAANLTINSRVKNVTVAAGKLVMNEKTSAQDLFAAAEDVAVSGTVRNTSIAGGKILFNAASTEDVTILTGEQINFGPSTAISGNLLVKSKTKPVGFDSIKVLGTRKFEESKKQRPGDAVFDLVVSIFSLLAVVYVLWALPGIRNKITSFPLSLKSILLPILWAVLIPIVLILLLITVIGVPLMVLVGILALLGLLLAKASAIIYLGNMIAANRNINVHVVLILLSVFAILAGVAPYIGWIIPFALGIFGWAIAVYLFQTAVRD